MDTYHDFTFPMPPEPDGYWRIDWNTLVARYGKPSRWHRFWYWALLGWRYEPSKDSVDD